MTHCQRIIWGSQNPALTTAVSTLPTTPPTAPSHVLPGLIAGAIFHRPRLFPTYMAAESPTQTTAHRNRIYHCPAGRRRRRTRWLRFQPIKSTPKLLYTNVGKTCDSREGSTITLSVNATILRNNPIGSQRQPPR